MFFESSWIGIREAQLKNFQKAMMLIACARDPILFWKTGNVGLLPYIPTRESFVINIDAVVIKNVEQQRRGGGKNI